jgi:hypothetical protein
MPPGTCRGSGCGSIAFWVGAGVTGCVGSPKCRTGPGFPAVRRGVEGSMKGRGRTLVHARSSLSAASSASDRVSEGPVGSRGLSHASSRLAAAIVATPAAKPRRPNGHAAPRSGRSKRAGSPAARAVASGAGELFRRGEVS